MGKLSRLEHILDRLILLMIGFLLGGIRKYSSRVPHIKGDKQRVKLGNRVSLVNTLINVSSGDVTIGDDTIFGHNCVIATGIHLFEGGMRKKLYHRKKFGTEIKEVPTSGFDVSIGKGCWIH